MNNTISIPRSLFDNLCDLGESVDTSELRKRNRVYLEWITDWPCAACGRQHEKIDAHHVDTPGLSMKCPDEHTVPLCHRSCHLDGVHRGQETFLKSAGLFDRYGYHALQLATLVYMAYFILSRSETERTRPGSQARQVARRFFEMATDSRLTPYLNTIYV